MKLEQLLPKLFYTDEIAPVMAEALGEPVLESNKIAKKWRRYQNDLAQAWHESGTFSMSESIERANRIALKDERLIRTFLSSNGMGVVLLTIHMGDYVHSILRMLSLSSPRKVVILRRKVVTKSDLAFVEKISSFGHGVEIVSGTIASNKKIVRTLREGGIAVLLYDLPRGWGETTPVSILNSDLEWVLGPFLLAKHGKAYVLPFYCREEKQESICHVLPVRDFGSGFSKQTDLVLEARAMAGIAEDFIKKSPHQWSNWNMFQQMKRVET